MVPPDLLAGVGVEHRFAHDSWPRGGRLAVGPGPRVGVALLDGWFHHTVESHTMLHRRRGTAAGRAGDPLPPSPVPASAFDALSTSVLGPRCGRCSAFGPQAYRGEATRTRRGVQRRRRSAPGAL